MVVTYAQPMIVNPAVQYGAEKISIVVPQEIRPPQDPVEVSLYVEGKMLMTAYSAIAQRFFTAYAGPDEAPEFDPDDYPIR